MKKIIGIFISALCGILLTFTVLANPLDGLTDFLNEFANAAGETTQTPSAPETPPAQNESPGSSVLQQRIDTPEPENSQQPAEPEVPGIPKDSPISTTGATYGYTGPVNIDTASSEQVNLTEGEWDINDVQMLFWGGTVIENSGTSSLAVRNSYIRGETAMETTPLEGDPGNLLVAGSIRTTLGTGNSENIYINSSVISRNRAALSTDAAQPAQEGSRQELSLYAYGTEAITMDGGYGAYSDLLCNLYSYGSHFQAAEIGIISGTYGKVTVGTIGDGESNAALAAVLTEDDKSVRSDKELRSIVEGGRNALMIHSVNLPPYWEYDGYSQEELPLLSAKITAHGSTFRTDLSLDRNVEYEPQKQAYIDHTRGSVILIKSTNADLVMDGCSIVPDEKGTGYLIQTVYNNDTQFMNAVPDGQTYPGINISMRDMKIAGAIAHEDYQRDLNLVLAGTTLDGSMNEYDCAHWAQAAQQEGFTDYSPDTAYNTHHGLLLTMQEGSVWNVTEESHLSRLAIGNDCKVVGIIYVDGEKQPNKPGTTYEGNVVVTPGTPEEETAEQETAAQPETKAPETTTPETKTPESTEHVHNWQHEGGSPATCTEDATYGWVCYECGANYLETLEGTAMGHDWQLYASSPPTCENPGQNLYRCTRCSAEYTDELPAKGHSWVLQASKAVTCLESGYDIYQCSYCGLEEWFNFTPATGHDYIIYPTPGAESITHTYECWHCGDTYTETHVSAGLGYCPVCGYSGAYGKADHFAGMLWRHEGHHIHY